MAVLEPTLEMGHLIIPTRKLFPTKPTSKIMIAVYLEICGFQKGFVRNFSMHILEMLFEMLLPTKYSTPPST
jgi:hypothetical protein